MTTVLQAATNLRDVTVPLTVPLDGAPIALNPLDYAWEPHEAYIQRFAGRGAKTLWLGMNPGPWGMAQTGIPFGAVNRVKDFLGIQANVRQPAVTHPKRPILGFECSRVEVSGDRLWGFVADQYDSPEAFFDEHFVLNYCPLLWQSSTGANLTPDKLPKEAMNPIHQACDTHLQEVIDAMEPTLVLGVGVWAEKRAKAVLKAAGRTDVRVGRVLHPSPASPAANRGWAPQVAKQLTALGLSLPSDR